MAQRTAGTCLARIKQCGRSAFGFCSALQTGRPLQPDKRPTLRCLHTSDVGQGLLEGLLQTAKSKNPITTQWYGQALHETHPELVAKDETTPGIARGEYERRRRQLVESLADGSVAFLFSAPMHFVSPHVFHKYRQDSDFYYLTGWDEPDSAVVLEKNKHASRGYTMTMFVRPKEPEKELWEGPRSGLEAAVDIFGADEARPIDELEKYATKLVAGDRNRVAGEDWRFYVDLDSEHGLIRSSHSNALAKILRREQMGSRVRQLTTLVQRARLIKSPAEIRLMREANRVSSVAFTETMSACRPGLCEATLQSIFEYASKMALVDSDKGGSTVTASDCDAIVDRSSLTRPAYVPVFASGEHALCMHYVQNQSRIKDGELILVDAGAEYAAYASDLTRTFPVSGKFNGPQRDLYSALLSVQEQMIRFCHAGSGFSLNEIHRHSTGALVSELKQIGFHVSEHDINRYLCPHHISHYLGMDVHDTIDMTRSQQLEPNMVVTVEPGLYVPYDSKFPKAFQGIGIRIEDDIVVGNTEAEIENLSRYAPKTVSEIEACMCR
ncbi:Creatinase/aminopeptidase [Coemansia reversa NRRL 1564]|uniref:Creatinase/aminopeptidase n=1 Tax=Coemansia reversa (strain ATCC 12441 / NRRL 1564) TaxID=763665 RepID=A0A2G5BA21_COERN|nr:Creatinase/aminopeptidase [Coemansia reversa NRRL 1564]|eukprot:PIA15853.1 Creatinase/aminopeptidase [Coemansia reversa NRRL 1564]